MTNDLPEISEHFIDIEKVFAVKNPRLHRSMPKFIFNYLRKVIHEDFINNMIYTHREKTGLDFVKAVLGDFGVNIKVYLFSGDRELSDDIAASGIIPPSGNFIIASNHPLGGLDGMALIHVAGQLRPDIVFPVNDLLMNIPGLKPLFIPINKHGKNNENVKIIDETFRSEKLVLYFPAGLVSRKGRKGTVCDLEWKKTFITRARKYRRDIIPVHISGRNSEFFYNLSNWRRRLGIKANIEMVWLPDEMIRQKDKTLRLTFGEPIPWTSFDKSKTDQEWAEHVKNKVYSLDLHR
jgi:putative hemolysin